MTLGRSAVLLCFVMLTGAGPALAQELPNPEQVRLDLGPYLHPGNQIRISGEALRRVQGHVLRLAPDTIFLNDASGNRTVPLAQIDTLWTRGHPTLLGFGIGISIGATIGGATCVFGSDEKCTGLWVGTAAGALLGTAIGRLRTTWSRRFTRRDGGPVPVIQPFERR
jgi:hypothetical protein